MLTMESPETVRLHKRSDNDKAAVRLFDNSIHAVTDPDLKATIDDNAPSTVDTVTYLGVTFSRNACNTYNPLLFTSHFSWIS